LVISSLNLDMEYSIPRSFIMTFATLSEAKEALNAQPVQALRAQPPEVLAVALFAVSAVAAHFGEVYLSWYDHI